MAYRRSLAVYHLFGPVNRPTRAANRSGSVDLLPVWLTGVSDRLAELRGRLAGVGRRTGRAGGGQERLRGARVRLRDTGGRLSGRCRAMGLNGPSVFVFFYLTSKFRKLY